MDNPVFAPKPAPQRFRVIQAFLVDLPAKLEEAAAEGWQFCGGELASKPGEQSYALLTKIEYPEPTPEQRVAFEQSMASGNQAQAATDRLLKIAEALFERLGHVSLPEKTPDPDVN